MAGGKVTFGKAAPQVSVGLHEAIFAGYSEQSGQNGFGPGIKFDFAIADGPEKGRQASRTCSTKNGANPSNVLGQFLSGIVGKEPAEGEEIDLAKYVGKKYRINVQRSKQSSGVRVEAVFAM